VKRFEQVEADSTYHLLGVRWYGNGCHLHSTVPGNKLRAKTLNRIHPDDVIYNKMWISKSAFGVASKDHAGFFATNEYPTFEANPETLDVRYFRYLMSRPTFTSQAKAAAKGTTSRVRLHPRDFVRLEVLLPPLPEQKKIAEILGSVDEAIRATKALIEQTRRVKQGLLQQLLTRGIGHTRFKMTEIGEIPESWEVARLDDVALRKTGHTPDKKKPEYWDGGILWVSLTDSANLDRVYLSDTAKQISLQGIQNSSAVVLPTDTVILSRDAGVGKSAILSEAMAVSQHFVAWICGQHLEPRFLYYYLQSQKPEFERVAIGSTIKTIGMPYFKRFLVPLPPLDEQMAISARLFQLDSVEFLLERELDETVEMKRGIANDLLSGQVRVAV